MARKKKPTTASIVAEFLKTEGIFSFENYDGLLFVGDPHLASKRPGTRLDENFMKTVLDKLEQSVEIALSKNLFMVILGDLFHDDSDHNPLMLTRLIQIFKRLPCAPVTIVGNHEKRQTTLTDDTFCAALREAGVLYTIEKNGFWARFKFNEDHVYLGGTPYGQTIPTEIKSFINQDYVNVASYNIWITHHDLAIDAYYPGCIEPFEIDGCHMLVNGHDHTTKTPVLKGQTMYFNPGNITRMSVDKKDHVPSVWAWYAKEKRVLQQIPLKYKENIFDLTGRQIKAQVAQPTKSEIEKNESKFLSLLQDLSQKENEQDITDLQSIDQSVQALAAILSKDDDFINEIKILTQEAAREI